MKKLSRIAMTMFVAAATVFVFPSCNKDEDNASGSGSGGGSQAASVSEADIIGTWLFPADHSMYKGQEFDINADHTLTFPGSYTFTWTLSGNNLTAVGNWGGSTLTMEFNIRSVTASEMTFGGSFVQDGVSRDISCTLTKISVPIEQLPDIIVGTWSGRNAADHQIFDDMTLNTDGTASQEVGIEENGTWSLDGTTLTVCGTCTRYDGAYTNTYTIVVSKIRKRDGKYQMSVSGRYIMLLNGEEQRNSAISGTMRRAVE